MEQYLPHKERCRTEANDTLLRRDCVLVAKSRAAQGPGFQIRHKVGDVGPLPVPAQNPSPSRPLVDQKLRGSFMHLNMRAAAVPSPPPPSPSLSLCK